MSRRGEWVIIILILLLAASLRFWMLGEVPPGLFHDEVINWQIAEDIRAGHYLVFSTAGYGREVLYHYGLAATVALFGDHWLGLRYASVAFGILGLAVTYALIRRLFGKYIALLTAAWLAVSFWPLFYARAALRAISLPLTAALAVYFLVRTANLPPSHATNPRVRRSTQGGLVSWLLAGIFLGLSFYTYMASRIFPVIIAVFLIYLFLVRRPTHIPWRGLLVFLLAAVIVSAPLVIWLVSHPGAEYRISEVREPLDRLFAGDPSLVRQNLIANLKFFTFAGDPWPHQNYNSRPVFADPASAALFYMGLLIALWRWRDPRYGFLLIWLSGALVPSILTSVAPSSARDILGLIVVFVFPALGLVEAVRWVRKSIQQAGDTRQNHRLISQACRFLLPAIGILVLASCLILTVRDYFIGWRHNDVARFFYQADLAAVAHRLDEVSAGTPITVAGLSVHTMDRPSLDLAARQDVNDIRLADTRETLVIPAGSDVLLFVPQVVPFDADLEERLMAWGATAETDSQASFTSYRLSDDTAFRRGLDRLENQAALPDGAHVLLPVSFGGRLAFLGYEWLQQAPTPGGVLILLTYWRVEEPLPAPLRIFVHVVDEPGEPVAQHDGLGSPPHGWASGDLVIQKHVVPLQSDLPPGRYRVQVGVYDANTNVRLPVLAADRLLLDLVEVTE